MNVINVVCRVGNVAILSICLLSSTAVLALEPDLLTPVLRNGLWVMQNKSSAFGGAPITRICAGTREKEISLLQKERKAVTQNCKILDHQRSQAKTSFNALCKFEGAEVSLLVENVGDFTKSFTTSRTVDRNLPAPYVKNVETLEYRFIGSCPNGMASGRVEIVEKSGVVVGKYNRYQGEPVAASAGAKKVQPSPIAGSAPSVPVVK